MFPVSKLQRHGLVGLLVGGCLSAGLVSFTKLPQPPAFTEADNGHTVTSAVGKTFELTLPENPTTGYRWQPVGSFPSQLHVEADTYVADAHTAGMVGVGGKHHWTFRAQKRGQATIRLVYTRPWLKQPNKGDKQFTLTVTVK